MPTLLSDCSIVIGHSSTYMSTFRDPYALFHFIVPRAELKVTFGFRANKHVVWLGRSCETGIWRRRCPVTLVKRSWLFCKRAWSIVFQIAWCLKCCPRRRVSSNSLERQILQLPMVQSFQIVVEKLTVPVHWWHHWMNILPRGLIISMRRRKSTSFHSRCSRHGVWQRIDVNHLGWPWPASHISVCLRRGVSREVNNWRPLCSWQQ